MKFNLFVSKKKMNLGAKLLVLLLLSIAVLAVFSAKSEEDCSSSDGSLIGLADKE